MLMTKKKKQKEFYRSFMTAYGLMKNVDGYSIQQIEHKVNRWHKHPAIVIVCRIITAGIKRHSVVVPTPRPRRGFSEWCTVYYSLKITRQSLRDRVNIAYLPSIGHVVPYQVLMRRHSHRPNQFHRFETASSFTA